MHDFLSHAISSRWSGEDDDIRLFAGRVVDVLARQMKHFDTGPREQYVAQLVAASVASDASALESEVARMLRNRVPAEVIADRYIPAVARKLGAGWDDDMLAFGEVSIGVARLQSVLRDLGESWSAHRVPAGSRANVLLTVPEGEDHTLGAVVAAGHLRRSGVSVCLKLQASLSDLGELVQDRGFDAVLISAANAERISQIARVVDTVRTAGRSAATKAGVPVFVGGAITDRCEGLARATGADLATADLDTVVQRLDAAATTNRASRRA
jgi:MerR family transcriptional regulator, light-induced transcriptional regulator